MRILLITSIFPPDIGGPAMIAQKLATILPQKGIEVKVLCFPKFSKYPKFARYFIYFLKLLNPILKVQVIYCLSSSPGITLFPLILSKIFQKKFIIRPGGDFLWERVTERGETDLSLKEYYFQKEYQKKRFLYYLLNFIFKNADLLIFPTHYLRNLYLEYYDIKKERAEFIDYPFPEIKSNFPKSIERPKQILFAGRLIRFKNLPRLIEAFSKIKLEGVILKIVGEGPQKENLKSQVRDLKLEERVIFSKPLSHQDLLKEIQKSYLVIIPSIFEPGSFFALECLKLKTPILLTREAGLYDIFKDKLIFIDPLNINDIKNKIEFLLNEENWRDYLQKIFQIDTNRNWQNFALDHIKIFEKIL